MRLGDIGQISMTVSDVAVAKAFYTEVIGLPFLFDAGPKLAFLMAGSVRLMLSAPEGAGEPGKNSVLYFRTDNVDETHRDILARGASHDSGPELVARMPDHELWMSFVRDPDGNLVAFMEERR